MDLVTELTRGNQHQGNRTSRTLPRRQLRWLRGAHNPLRRDQLAVREASRHVEHDGHQTARLALDTAEDWLRATTSIPCLVVCRNERPRHKLQRLMQLHEDRQKKRCSLTRPSVGGSQHVSPLGQQGDGALLHRRESGETLPGQRSLQERFKLQVLCQLLVSVHHGHLYSPAVDIHHGGRRLGVGFVEVLILLLRVTSSFLRSITGNNQIGLCNRGFRPERRQWIWQRLRNLLPGLLAHANRRLLLLCPEGPGVIVVLILAIFLLGLLEALIYASFLSQLWWCPRPRRPLGALLVGRGSLAAEAAGRPQPSRAFGQESNAKAHRH
mmetsp:Transcript_69247/g.150708  ORF Transcript_69247/g.150708 Transcript_69247/m.150708 type:complete len:325 (+) Transcript_69247:1405-2379(+)